MYCKVCGKERPLNEDGVCESCYFKAAGKPGTGWIPKEEPNRQYTYAPNYVPLVHGPNHYKKSIGNWLIIVGIFVTLLLWIASSGFATASIHMKAIQSVAGNTTAEAYYDYMGTAMGGFGVGTFALSLLLLFGSIAGGIHLIKQSK